MSINLEINYDKDGYPTEASLDNIIKYIFTGETPDELYDFMVKMSEAFEGHGSCEYNHTEKLWYVSTYGWSGCEDIIWALKLNRFFWRVCWVSSERGGHYKFDTSGDGYEFGKRSKEMVEFKEKFAKESIALKPYQTYKRLIKELSKVKVSLELNSAVDQLAVIIDLLERRKNYKLEI
jgi:hypothetical protein